MQTTIFIPLSGRKHCWEILSKFLENQNINKNLFHLFLLDTSGDDKFNLILKNWLEKKCNYANFELEKKSFSTIKNLVGFQRKKNFSEVNHVMCGIYNYAKNIIKGEYIFIIEDDVIPPLNAFNMLKKHLNNNVVAVSGAYQIRCRKNLWVAWDSMNSPVISKRGKGVSQVASTGFGCILLKSNDFIDSEISWHYRNTPWPWGYDMEFFSKQKKKVLINWDVFCDHLDENTLKSINVKKLKI